MKFTNIGLTFCLLTFLFIKAGNAQNAIGEPQIEYSSKLPEVKEMQRAIDFPVSYFTGQADVSIALYTASSKTIEVPIVLRYSSGGIKADEVMSRYGIGWNLIAGGSITRVIRGNEDEGIRFETTPHKQSDFKNDTVYNKWNLTRDSIINLYHKYGGFYVDGGNVGHSSSDLHNAFVSHNQDLSTNNNPSPFSLLYFNEGLCDGEPDVFYYNFGNHSGKFIFGPDNAPILIPYNEDLKIIPEIKYRVDKEMTPTAADPHDSTVFKMYYFNSFKISTPEGKDYYFGEDDNSKILTPVLGKPSKVNGWQLTRIVDRITADTVYFEYHTPGPATISDLENKQLFVKNTGGCPDNWSFRLDNQPNFKGEIAKIITGKETVLFGNAITVLDRTTEKPYRKISLSLSLLSSRRRALSKIIDNDLLKNSVAIYTFDYYDLGNYGGQTAQDFWGYHNGKSNGTKLMIGYPGCTSGVADRFASWPEMELDALKAVNYPTGGKTIFEYEPHDAFAGRMPNDQIAESDAYSVGQGLNFNILAPNSIGGIRIKRLLQYDPVSKDTLVKRFIYKRFGTNNSSGFLASPPVLNVDYSSLACGGSVLSPLYLRSGKNLYIGSGTGQHVTYNNVTVREEKNGVPKGRTEYEYFNDLNTDSCFYSNALTDSTNFSLNDQYNVFPSTQFKLLPENLLSGRQKEKRVYDSAGVLLQQETDTYKSKIYNGFQSAIIFNAIYKKDACQVVLTPYGGQNGMKDKNWLPMDEYMNIYQDWYRESDADMEDMQLLTFFKAGKGASLVLPSPYRNGKYYDAMPFFTLVKSRGPHPIVPPPYSFNYMYRYATTKIAVRPYKIINKTYQSPSKVVIDTTTYLYENPQHVNATSIVTHSSTGDTKSQQFLYAFDFNDVNNGDSTIYFMKQAFVNLPVATFNYVNSNIVAGAYRSYHYKSRAQADVFFVNNENRLLHSVSGLSPSTLNITSGYPKTLNFPSTYFDQIASFNYNPDNSVFRVTQKGDDKTIFLWDYNKTYVVAKATGADSADIAFTSFETNYNGNWNVAGSARDTLVFLTGKRSYNLSAGNITRTGLSSSKIYTVSYWSATTAATVNSTSATQGATKNGWTYYQHTLPSGTTSVTISGNVKIDELRLFPAGAQISSFTFEPVLGISSADLPNNTISYYNYDGMSRLVLVKDPDKNILKSAEYFQNFYSTDTAMWEYTYGVVQKKCTADTNYYDHFLSYQQIDVNPNSATYNTYRWVDRSSDADISAWEYMDSLRCVKDVNNKNTGYVEKLQKDMNPCSSSYNQTRWVAHGTNLSYCPLPCEGENMRVINGVCTAGTKIITASVYDQGQKKWSCKYHYEWLPDCIKSIDYYEYRSTPCMPGGSCVPL